MVPEHLHHKEAAPKAGSKLDRHAEEIAAMLDAGTSISATARKCGVDRSTLRHWLRTRRAVPHQVIECTSTPEAATAVASPPSAQRRPPRRICWSRSVPVSRRAAR